MSDVFYGNYLFSPAPIFTLEDEPLFIEGKLDYFKQNITLIGNLTGCNIESVRLQKDELVLAHTTGFLELTIGNTGFAYARPLSINFSDSKLTKFLPFEITYEAYQNNDFSQYYGILDPTDEWSYSEEGERTFSATHKVSARAASIDTNSIERVKSFVSGRLNGYENLSLFLTGTTAVLSSVTENFSRITNTYSIEEQYLLSQFGQWDKSGAIIRPKASISYNEGAFSLIVNGSIKGGISTPVSTGLFSPSDARMFAINAMSNSLGEFEGKFYNISPNEPNTYSYEVNTGSNDIIFNFSFGNPSNLITGDVRHEYTVNFEVSKDQIPVTATLAGRVFYQGPNPFIFGVEQEEQLRWQAVERYFSGINPYLITNEHFSYYLLANFPYSKLPLNTFFESSTIDKNSFENSINYNFTFTNKINLITGLLNPSITINRDYPIPVYSIKPTCDNSFSVQETYNKIKRTTVSVNGTIPTGISVNAAMLLISQYMQQYEPANGTISSVTLVTGDKNISLTKTFINE